MWKVRWIGVALIVALGLMADAKPAAAMSGTITGPNGFGHYHGTWAGGGHFWNVYTPLGTFDGSWSGTGSWVGTVGYYNPETGYAQTSGVWNGSGGFATDGPYSGSWSGVTTWEDGAIHWSEGWFSGGFEGSCYIDPSTGTFTGGEGSASGRVRIYCTQNGYTQLTSVNANF